MSKPYDQFDLVVDDHVPFVNPRSYGITDFKGINPNDYFVTSGDAVSKAKFLEKEMWDLAGSARKKFGTSRIKKHKEFVAAVWKAAGRCRAMVKTLEKARGDAIFLETEWINHQLICKPKNPRARDDIDE